MRRDQVFLHSATADQVLLDDSLEHRRVALAVPRSLRIDDGDRTAFTDAQAVGLGAQDAAVLGEAQLFQALLEKVPGGQAALLVTALRRRLIVAQEDLPARRGDADRVRDVSLAFSLVVVHQSQTPSFARAVRRSWCRSVQLFRHLIS